MPKESVDAAAQSQLIRHAYTQKGFCVRDGVGDLREAGVVLEDVVAREVVEREPGGVGLRVGGDGKVEEELGEALVEVDGGGEAVREVLLGDVLARAGQEAVVREGVQERAGAADWN